MKISRNLIIANDFSTKFVWTGGHNVSGSACATDHAAWRPGRSMVQNIITMEKATTFCRVYR